MSEHAKKNLNNEEMVEVTGGTMPEVPEIEKAPIEERALARDLGGVTLSGGSDCGLRMKIKGGGGGDSCCNGGPRQKIKVMA